MAAQLLSETVTKGKTTDATFCTIEVTKARIILRPDNGETFFHTEQVVDVCRAFGLSNYTTIDFLTDTDRPQVEVNIY